MCGKPIEPTPAEAPGTPLGTDKLADIWISHNTLRWRVVLSTPIFSATVMVGWFSLRQAGVPDAPEAVLSVGVVAMMAYFILIRRLADYAGAYYRAIPAKPKVPPAWCGLPASKMALSIPVLLGILFLILLFFDVPFPPKGEAQ